MKLAAWRKEKGWTQGELGTNLGVGQSYISRIERPAKSRGWMPPGYAVLIEIFCLTEGSVTPNDFYDLPDLAVQRKAA